MFSKAHSLKAVKIRDYVVELTVLPDDKILDWSKLKAFLEDK